MSIVVIYKSIQQYSLIVSCTFNYFIIHILYCYSYIDDLFHMFNKLQGVHRTRCLEMFLNKLPIIDNPYEKISKLDGFFNLLKNK